MTLSFRKDVVTLLTSLFLLSLSSSFLAWQSNLQGAFDRAVEHFQSGNYALAENEFRQISQALPQAPEPCFYLGRIHLQNNRADEAEVWLRKAVSLNPDFVDAWKILGQLYSEKQGYKQAREALLEVLKREPRNANAHFNLANTLEKLGDDVQAIQEFETAMRLPSADSFVSAKARSNSGLLYLKLGKIHNQNQRTAEAVRDLEIAHERIGPSYELYVLLGEVYSKNKDPRALEYLLKAAELSNSREISNAQLIQAFDKDRFATESLDQLRQKASAQPENAAYQILLGSVLWDREEYLNALHHYQQVVRLHPKSARAHYLVGFVNQLMGNAAAAKESLQTALALDPGFVPTQLTLGELLTGEGNWEQAAALLKKVGKEPSNDMSVLLKLGQLFLDHGDLESARAQLILAETKDSRNKKVHYLLGRLYLALGQRELAQRHFAVFSQLEDEELEKKRRK